MENHPTANAGEHDREFAYRTMEWHGFGSPVGLGILLVSIGLSAVLVRFALIGFD